MTDEELMGRWALIIQALKFKTRFQGKMQFRKCKWICGISIGQHLMK